MVWTQAAMRLVCNSVQTLPAQAPVHSALPCAFHPPRVQDERKAAAVGFLREVGPPPRPDLYIPTNPDCRVLSVIPESGAPMQASVVGAGAGAQQGCGNAGQGMPLHLPRLAGQCGRSR